MLSTFSFSNKITCVKERTDGTVDVTDDKGTHVVLFRDDSDKKEFMRKSEKVIELC